MKFGRIPVEQCEGAILAGPLQAYGKKWKKGRKLSRYDVEVLQSLSIETVIAARLEDRDVDEDAAAEAIARVICGEGLEARAPATGRCNLYAKHRGLLQLRPERIHAINSVNEAFTVATLPNYCQVYAGQLAVSVKIIPFGVSRELLSDCIAEANYGAAPINVLEYRPMSIGLIQTHADWFNRNLLKKGKAMLDSRAEMINSKIVAYDECGHHESDVSKLLVEYFTKDLDLILLLGASAIQGRQDVIPQGIVNAGGRIEHFGMPVDPGNLLLKARYRKIDILGLPGCVRTPKRNGFDLVFERLAAGIEVLPSDIVEMGHGGIMLEPSKRPVRRTVEESLQISAERKIAAIVLAAGQSSRMGGHNKLFLRVGERSMIQQVVANLADSAVDRIFVVTGHERERVRNELKNQPVTFVHNREFSKGLSTSLRSALARLPKEISAAMICLADMPFVGSLHINALIEAYDPKAERSICVPTYQGKRGNPVLWDRRYFQQMMEIQGDVGAKHIIGEYDDSVIEVEIDDAGVLTDVDTPESYAKMGAVLDKQERTTTAEG